MQSKLLQYDGREYRIFEDGIIIGPKGKPLTWFYNNDGYPYVCTKSGTAYVHRLVALAFIPNPYGYKEIDHLDSNPGNPHVSNLEWVTHAENVRRAAAKGAYRGENNGGAKLNKYEVMAIKGLSSIGLKPKQISLFYPIVSRKAVYNIVTGRQWPYIKIITDLSMS